VSDLEAACLIADAALYEGHRPSPYDASAVRDQDRGQLGVVVPPGFTAADEPSAVQTECLLEGGRVGILHVRCRFLHVRARTAEGAESYDEVAEREIDVVWSLADLLAAERVHDERIPGGRETADGLTRNWEPLDVRIRASAQRLPGPYGVVRLRLRLENTGDWTGGERPEALRRSLVAAHILLALSGGVFLSPADPPEWARPYAEDCQNLRTWPMLIADDLVLSSPINLEDRPRAAATIDRAAAKPLEPLERPHGAIRSPGPRRGGDVPADDVPADDVPVFTTGMPWWDPGADASVDPETDRVTVAGHEVGKGSKVRLRPAGRADAQDVFLAGRVATVEAVLLDVDGSRHLAVTVDDDPGTDLRRAQGRYWYFAPGDVEPLRKRKILVAGVGNIFLGDDGFGVEVVRRLSERPAETELPDGVEVGDFGIRGIHLAYELSSYDTTILVDATPRGEEPGTLCVLELGKGVSPTVVNAHGMTPDAVLDLVGVVGGKMGRILLVGCEPADVSPGMELSRPVAAAIEPAVRLVRELIEEELRDHQTIESRDGAVS
jgi:hydrogenase maturation protease